MEAGAHFGHLKRKWNPKMAPYIFMEKNGIHIIDLHKTVLKIDEAAAAIKQMSDGWTVKTADGKYAAHYENTILITAGDPELLTDPAESLV